MTKPNPTLGMHHVALNVSDVKACEHFYVDLVGMAIEWRPDPDNIYLTSGSDNVAIHKAAEDLTDKNQHLDHIGFIIESIDQVNLWHDYLVDNGVKIKKAPRTHRDGAHSFYCYDPDGNLVQFIYHPPLVKA